MSKSTYKAAVDEDVDDLDDVLSEFSKPAPSSTSKAPQQQQQQQTQDEPEMDQAFLAELSKNMESLFSKNLAGGPEDGGPGDMKAFLEAMMRESASDEAGGQVSQEEVDKAMKDLDAQLGKTAQPKEKGKASTSAAGFQEAIRQSMDKVNASDASARVGAAFRLLLGHSVFSMSPTGANELFSKRRSTSSITSQPRERSIR